MSVSTFIRTWSPQYDAILREGVAINLSFDQIAALLPGVTRDAVAGRAKRLGLKAWKPPAAGPVKNRSVNAFANIVKREREVEPQSEPEPEPPRCGLRVFSFERTDGLPTDRPAGLRTPPRQYALGREQRAGGARG